MNLKKHQKRTIVNIKSTRLMRPIVNNKSTESRLIYILFNQKNNQIKVFHESEKKPSLLSKGYQTIGNKLGTKRESKLINIILEELYKLDFTNGYKEKLISYLNTLGFNTISSKKISKKMVLTN